MFWDLKQGPRGRKIKMTTESVMFQALSSHINLDNQTNISMAERTLGSELSRA